MRIFETYHQCGRIEEDKLSYCCFDMEEQMKLPVMDRIGMFMFWEGSFKLVPWITIRTHGIPQLHRGKPFNFCPYCGEKFTC